MIDLQKSTGLPIQANSDTQQLILPAGFEPTTYRIREAGDLDAVWQNPDGTDDRVIYWYSSGLTYTADRDIWKKANIVYGIVFFYPGCFNGEYVKSSGQYHPPQGESQTATPEIYTVLKGTGYFLLQKAKPPYSTVSDAVLVEVREGESFIVPPDYGHLQINPSSEPLIFSYVVMDGLNGVYEPFKKKKGAMYYVVNDPVSPYRFNHRYPDQVDLRVLRASELRQHAILEKPITYHYVKQRLGELNFITRPELYPSNADLNRGKA